METGNASVSEERPLECAEHQSCILSPEVPPSPKAKSKYMYSVNKEAVLHSLYHLNYIANTFIQTYELKKIKRLILRHFFLLLTTYLDCIHCNLK